MLQMYQQHYILQTRHFKFQTNRKRNLDLKKNVSSFSRADRPCDDKIDVIFLVLEEHLYLTAFD